MFPFARPMANLSGWSSPAEPVSCEKASVLMAEGGYSINRQRWMSGMAELGLKFETAGDGQLQMADMAENTRKMFFKL